MRFLVDENLPVEAARVIEAGWGYSFVLAVEPCGRTSLQEEVFPVERSASEARWT
jgi:hypothetical protein